MDGRNKVFNLTAFKDYLDNTLKLQLTVNPDAMGLMEENLKEMESLLMRVWSMKGAEGHQALHYIGDMFHRMGDLMDKDMQDSIDQMRKYYNIPLSGNGLSAQQAMYANQLGALGSAVSSGTLGRPSGKTIANSAMMNNTLAAQAAGALGVAGGLFLDTNTNQLVVGVGNGTTVSIADEWRMPDDVMDTLKYQVAEEMAKREAAKGKDSFVSSIRKVLGGL